MTLQMLFYRSMWMQERIQDLKKEGAQGVRGLTLKNFLANLGDFLKNLAQKGVGVRLLQFWIRAWDARAFANNGRPSPTWAH